MLKHPPHYKKSVFVIKLQTRLIWILWDLYMTTSRARYQEIVLHHTQYTYACSISDLFHMLESADNRTNRRVKEYSL